jgi:hypothetical protein
MEMSAPIAYVAGINPKNFLTLTTHGQFLRFHTYCEKLTPGKDDFLLVCDVNQKALDLIERLEFPRRKCILIRNEPIVVCPANYDPKVTAKFGKIVDIGRVLPDSTLAVPCPQTWPEKQMLEELPSEKPASRPVLMNSNKLSFVKGELYSLRREIIHAHPIDLYGPRWDSTLMTRLRTLIGELVIFGKSGLNVSRESLRLWWARHPRYLGLADDKLATYRSHKIAIALENSPDYMSEKLIDALLAGCIPIYCGPDVSEFGIPSELVVSCRPTLADVRAGLAIAEAMDYSRWSSKNREYLLDPDIKHFWSPERIYSLIANHVFADEGTAATHLAEH